MYWDYYCLKIIVSLRVMVQNLFWIQMKKKSMLIVINLLILTLTPEVHY